MIAGNWMGRSLKYM